MNDEDDSFDLDDIDGCGTVVPSSPGAHVMARPTRYSATLITQYQKCPASAYARITKQPENKSLALINGIALHEAIEKYIKHRADMREAYRYSFAENADKNDLQVDDPALGLPKILEDAGRMLDNAKANLDLDGFVDRINPELCEMPFSFERNNRTYVGKMDLVHFANPDSYSIVDWKSNKNAPNQGVLDRNLQFSLYHVGAYLDPALPTYQKWPNVGVWMHLRGKNIARDESGKAVRKVADKKFQYFFPTRRTPEEVEEQFSDSIEPVAAAMEAGVWYRNEADHCDWCGYQDKESKRCRVELPA